MKYQFCIRFNNIDANSAASKAVLDCNRIFSENGYTDYTFTVGDNSNKPAYYAGLFKQLIRFFFAVKLGSLVGIQYPLLSINHVFRYFIKLAKVKRIKFFCIVHDLESLRTGGKNHRQIAAEVANLNFYDCIIVHNARMLAWLREAGVTRQMIILELFDYLTGEPAPVDTSLSLSGDIVFAGNLRKSTFIYRLPEVKTRNFSVFGPGFKESALKNSNVKWCGQFSPDEIVKKLNGSFGLIWDGDDIDVCDEVLGNYLNYNNPHKCSLYLAAGLPVIAPKDSAIGDFIKKMNIGLLVESLHELDAIGVSAAQYSVMKMNVSAIREKIVAGYFFDQALKTVEAQWN